RTPVPLVGRGWGEGDSQAKPKGQMHPSHGDLSIAAAAEVGAAIQASHGTPSRIAPPEQDPHARHAAAVATRPLLSLGRGVADPAGDRQANGLAWGHAMLGRARIDLGDAEEALADIERAITLDPSEPSLFIWTYWAGLAALHAGKDAAALEWLLKTRGP